MRVIFFSFLLLLSVVEGFKCFQGRFSYHRVIEKRSKTNVCATTDSATIIDQITLKILSGMKSKIADSPSSAPMAAMLEDFLKEYAESANLANESAENYQTNVMTFIKSIQEAMISPFKFESFHAAVRQPFDYYTWGNNFLRPLIILEKSKLEGAENAKSILECLSKGENVMILSNHQTEADPQVLSILLERENMGELAEKMIFIAGHKVTSDPVAIPFSMGRNLICIHSKKHIRNPPEEFPVKQAQNLQSMKALGDLAAEGGKVFWVAPSGGRDRADETGQFVVSPLDSKSLDMFRLVAMNSKRPMHFFPMAMYTNNLVPPPKDVSSALGEPRSAKRGPVSVHFLPETNGLGGLKDKEFNSALEQSIVQAYADLVKWHQATGY